MCFTGTIHGQHTLIAAHPDRHEHHASTQVRPRRHNHRGAPRGVHTARQTALPVRRARRVAREGILEGDGLQLPAASRPRRSKRRAAASCLRTHTERTQRCQVVSNVDAFLERVHACVIDLCHQDDDWSRASSETRPSASVQSIDGIMSAALGQGAEVLQHLLLNALTIFEAS